MSQITIQDKISVNSPISKVWEAIEDPELHVKWHPFVTRIAGEHKLGAIRKCDVNAGGKHGHTEERCSLYEERRRIVWTVEKDSTGFSRMVSNWTAGFGLESKDDNTTIVTAQSAFQPRTLFARLTMPMIRSKFHRTQEAILNGLRQFAEKPS